MSQHTQKYTQPHQNQIIQRYLQQYAESLIHNIPNLTTTAMGHRSYQHVLVIPVYDEAVGCIEHALPSDIQNTLVIVVVNVAVDCDRSSIERTQHFLHSFTPTKHRFTAITYNTDTTLLVVDCCTEGRQMPAKQGVGLARKIGGDIALAYIAQGAIATNWIHYTDADAVLPQNFFARIPPSSQTPKKYSSQPGKNRRNDHAVMIYPFQHQPSHPNILLYEISLRYYVIQLAQARSPYAFHTIGSLMCINVLHYAEVRGFPKRKAAEDFYMLNKLAKTGSVLRLLQPVVTLDSRCSHRVPFGTGAMMTRLANAKQSSLPSPFSSASSTSHCLDLSPCLLYHPTIFSHLKDWLACIDELWILRRGSDHQAIAQWFTQGPWQNALWIPYLLEIGIEKTIQQAHRQCQDLAHFRFFMWTWFDAFRTLKFVHHLRDHHYPSIDLATVDAEIVLTGLRSPNHQLGAEILSTDRRSSNQSLATLNHSLQQIEQTFASAVGPTLSLTTQNH